MKQSKLKIVFFFVLFFFCEFHRNLSQANLKAHYSTKILWYLRENPKNQIWISCHNLKLVRLGYEIYLTGHWLGFQSDFLGLKLGSFEISYVWLECLFKSIKKTGYIKQLYNKTITNVQLCLDTSPLHYYLVQDLMITQLEEYYQWC